MKEKVEKITASILLIAVGIMTISAAFFTAAFAQTAFAVSFLCAAVCLFILVPMEIPEAQSWYDNYKDNDDLYWGL